MHYFYYLYYYYYYYQLQQKLLLRVCYCTDSAVQQREQLFNKWTDDFACETFVTLLFCQIFVSRYARIRQSVNLVKLFMF